MTGLNTETKDVRREQDSGETERESVWETECCWKQDGVGNKFDCWKKILMADVGG